jgi:OOP family OmpA-OmpF porin
MEVGIDASSGDFGASGGKLALIIVSDGIVIDNMPVMAAQDIKKQYGDRICIYTVAVGNHPGGKATMKQIADAGKCGFTVNADEIASSQAMAEFVKKVFLTGLADSDGDGVPDNLDRCPGTPGGVKVDARGCPLDTDGDGVYDYLDKCPGTPRGVKVDANGCPPEAAPSDADRDGVPDSMDKCPGTPRSARVDRNGCWILPTVLFDTAKWKVDSYYNPMLGEVAAVLKRNPALRMEIQGHTDSRGTARYNDWLSKMRANAVVEYFVKSGVDRDRFATVGFSATRPVASNLTVEGMTLNRRSELVPLR